MNNGCKQNITTRADWDAPTAPDKIHRAGFKSLGWCFPGWGAFFFILYPIAKHIGFWTSSIPAALLLGSLVSAIAYIFRRRNTKK